jgi:hypothetical protein
MSNNPVEFFMPPASDSGGGGGNDEKVKVTENDLIAGYLQSKVDAGEGVTITLQNPGANESLLIASSGDMNTALVDFDYTTPSPLPIMDVQPGDFVEQVQLFIDTVFNGTVSLTVGETGNIDNLMEATDNDPYTTGTYELSPGYTYASGTTIRLYLNVTSATQGSGKIYIAIGKE